MNQSPDIDFLVRPHGTVWMFEPLTERAKDHALIVMEVQVWQWHGPAFGVDHRVAPDLAAALAEEGFVVDSDDRPCRG
jgi:hypothetical protein